jgi:hypothetical protein
MAPAALLRPWKAAVETTLGAAVAGACLCEQALVLLGHCSRCARGSANDAVRALLDLTAGARPGAVCGLPAALAHHRATGRHLSPESPSTERNLRFFPALRSTRASRSFAGVFARFERLTPTTENRGVPGSSPGLAITKCLQNRDFANGLARHQIGPNTSVGLFGPFQWLLKGRHGAAPPGDTCDVLSARRRRRDSRRWASAMSSTRVPRHPRQASTTPRSDPRLRP